MKNNHNSQNGSTDEKYIYSYIIYKKAFKALLVRKKENKNERAMTQKIPMLTELIINYMSST